MATAQDMSALPSNPRKGARPMARTQPIQIPGETAQDMSAQDNASTGADTFIPGDDEGGADSSAAVQIAALQAQLAAANAQLAAKEAAAAKTPQVVFEPVTPHGAQALDASQFKHLTVAQLVAKIDVGEVKEPFVSVLCADGYYARR